MATDPRPFATDGAAFAGVDPEIAIGLFLIEAGEMAETEAILAELSDVNDPTEPSAAEEFYDGN